MRRRASLCLLSITLLPAISLGQQTKGETKTSPTEDAVVGLVGKDFAEVFTHFGVPQDIIGVNGPKGTQETVLDYGTFGFNIQNKKVRICQFWAGWPATVDGIKLGTPIDDVVKKLGKPLFVEKDANGAERQFWELTKGKLLVYFDVDKNRNASRAVAKQYDSIKSNEAVKP